MQRERNVFVVEGQPIQAGFEAFQRFWGIRSTPPPLITAVIVKGLGHTDWLAEMDAVAVVPAGQDAVSVPRWRDAGCSISCFADFLSYRETENDTPMARANH
ncbi:MAG TPA: hypothetical protein VFP66_06695 [Candidatus Limnocylindrales bacterium]|nr:hypothetical protein [Candidatus Limnocylindrales bacterium]